MFDLSDITRSGFSSISDPERLALLNAQIAYAAANSPYYRETLGQIAPLTALRDITCLPFLTPEILRAQGNRLACVPASEIARIVSLQTSGSTGAAKRLSFSREDLEHTVEFFTEGMGWLCAPGDRAAILMPSTAPDGMVDLLCRALRRMGAEPLVFGLRADMAALGQELLKAQPAVLVAFPWQARLLALLCPNLRPRSVVLSADYIPAPLQPMLRRVWHCAPIAHFGMTETGYGAAEEHPCAPGAMVLRRDALVAEIVDPETGAPLPPEQPGELVLTTLQRRAMPLLRYRTGDLAVMDAEGRLRRVFGRLGNPPFFYELQDRLCPLEWLYDYAIRSGRLVALAALDAPADSGALLSAAAGGIEVELRRIPPSAATLLQSGKRLDSASLY